MVARLFVFIVIVSFFSVVSIVVLIVVISIVRAVASVGLYACAGAVFAFTIVIHGTTAALPTSAVGVVVHVPDVLVVVALAPVALARAVAGGARARPLAVRAIGGSTRFTPPLREQLRSRNATLMSKIKHQFLAARSQSGEVAKLDGCLDFFQPLGR
jgi:hypothetical protein